MLLEHCAGRRAPSSEINIRPDSDAVQVGIFHCFSDANRQSIRRRARAPETTPIRATEMLWAKDVIPACFNNLHLFAQKLVPCGIAKIIRRTNQTSWRDPFMVRPDLEGLSRAMTTLSKGPDPNLGVRKALNHMKQAEAELLAVVKMESHSKNGQLLEAHAILWEAISILNKAALSPDKK